MPGRALDGSALIRVKVIAVSEGMLRRDGKLRPSWNGKDWRTPGNGRSGQDRQLLPVCRNGKRAAQGAPF
jgi:hypothetical protein